MAQAELTNESPCRDCETHPKNKTKHSNRNRGDKPKEDMTMKKTQVRRTPMKIKQVQN
jgi:hypothetical protein